MIQSFHLYHSYHNVQPHPLYAWGVEPPTRRVLLGKGVDFFQGFAVSTQKIKSETFNDKKKFINQKCFSLSQVRIETGKF